MPAVAGFNLAKANKVALKPASGRGDTHKYEMVFDEQGATRTTKATRITDDRARHRAIDRARRAGMTTAVARRRGTASEIASEIVSATEPKIARAVDDTSRVLHVVRKARKCERARRWRRIEPNAKRELVVCT